MNRADIKRFKSSRRVKIHASGQPERRIHDHIKPVTPVEATDEERRILKISGKYAAMSTPRVYAIVKGAQYVVRNNVPGVAVVCGVGLGGSALAILRAFRNEGVIDRPLWLYDTFDGDKRPEYDDYKASQAYVATILNKRCPQYDHTKIKFIPGMVEDTIPDTVPDQISILHLDTDWYESTRHELVHLWPRLVRGGVILIDDYGCWQSCRLAVDEYFAEHHINIMLSAVDHTGRIGVKV